VGFKFQAQGDGYIHSGVVMVLSPQGKVTRYIYGVSFQPADLQMAVQEAARGETRPSVNRLLEFCFNAEPGGRGVVMMVSKAIAALTFLFCCGFVAFLLFRKKTPVNR
jgi:protein SCO1/2